VTRIERPHGLPSGVRQLHEVRTGSVYRDVVYPEHGLIVELVGRLFHDSATEFDLDLERDLDSALDGRATIRLGWGQVFRRTCATAAKVGGLLSARGWRGRLLACPECRSPRKRYSGATG
jgi:hypothetical protein